MSICPQVEDWKKEKRDHIYELTYLTYLCIMGKLGNKGKIKILKRDNRSYITIPNLVFSWPEPLVRSAVVRKPTYFLQPQLNHKIALLELLAFVTKPLLAGRPPSLWARAWGPAFPDWTGTSVTPSHTPGTRSLAERWQSFRWTLNWYQIHSEQEALEKQVCSSFCLPRAERKSRKSVCPSPGGQGSRGTRGPSPTVPALQAAGGQAQVLFFIKIKCTYVPANKTYICQKSE